MKLTESDIEIYHFDDGFPENWEVILCYDTKEEADKSKQQILENQRLRELVEEKLIQTKKITNEEECHDHKSICFCCEELTLQLLLDKAKG